MTILMNLEEIYKNTPETKTSENFYEDLSNDFTS